MKRISLAFAFLWLCCSLLTAEPFGMEMGLTLDQILEAGARIKEGEEHETEYLLALDVPTPHPDLTVYIALVDKEVGLYYIQAVGVGSSDPKAGIALEDLYDKLHFQLSEKYGEPIAEVSKYDYQDFDYLNWMSEIEAKPVIACWGGRGESGIDTIILKPEVLDSGSGTCSVIYSGLNSSVIRQRNHNKGMNAL